MTKTNIALFGAGLVAPPLIRYFLEREPYQITIVSLETAETEKQFKGHPRCRIVRGGISDTARLAREVGEADLVVSLLPYVHHVTVARLCLEKGKPFLSTSYISPAMKELDRPAREKVLLFLNEIGLDPGIDHLAAMKIIDDVHARGGKVASFRSFCGGLPAPEANDNPLGYKFSWSPRGVLLAGRKPAAYRENGELRKVEGGAELFRSRRPVSIPGVEEKLEFYPNRDSLSYIEPYGIPEVRTMLRATLRYPGWCEVLENFFALHLVADDPPQKFAGQTLASWFRGKTGLPAAGPMQAALAQKLGCPEDSSVVKAFAWLGFFEEKPLPLAEGNTLDLLSALLQSRLAYRPGERDLIVLHHEFEAVFPAPASGERITATLVDYGVPHGDSAMARTVSLPAAIAARLILEGKIKATGVRAPLTREIYEPVLQELAELKIKFQETTTPLSA